MKTLLEFNNELESNRIVIDSCEFRKRRITPNGHIDDYVINFTEKNQKYELEFERIYDNEKGVFFRYNSLEKHSFKILILSLNEILKYFGPDKKEDNPELNDIEKKLEKLTQVTNELIKTTNELINQRKLEITEEIKDIELKDKSYNRYPYITEEQIKYRNKISQKRKYLKVYNEVYNEILKKKQKLDN